MSMQVIGIFILSAIVSVVLSVLAAAQTSAGSCLIGILRDLP